MSQSAILWVFGFLLTVSLGLQVWQFAQPPHAAIVIQLAEALGRKEATSLLVQAGNRELQQALAACQQAQPKKAPGKP